MRRSPLLSCSVQLKKVPMRNGDLLYQGWKASLIWQSDDCQKGKSLLDLNSVGGRSSFWSKQVVQVGSQGTWSRFTFLSSLTLCVDNYKSGDQQKLQRKMLQGVPRGENPYMPRCWGQPRSLQDQGRHPAPWWFRSQLQEPRGEQLHLLDPKWIWWDGDQL